VLQLRHGPTRPAGAHHAPTARLDLLVMQLGWGNHSILFTRSTLSLIAAIVLMGSCAPVIWKIVSIFQAAGPALLHKVGIVINDKCSPIMFIVEIA